MNLVINTLLNLILRCLVEAANATSQISPLIVPVLARMQLILYPCHPVPILMDYVFHAFRSHRFRCFLGHE
jgi:hypothetical protein